MTQQDEELADIESSVNDKSDSTYIPAVTDTVSGYSLHDCVATTKNLPSTQLEKDYE